MVKFTKEAVMKMLGNVPDDKVFWCLGGRVFKNLLELEAGLRKMSDNTFRYHCNETKSDFSNWIRDVIGYEALANDLRKCTTRAQAAKTVADRVAWLKTKTRTK